MRIPFDSLTLAAVAHELRPFVGAKVQRIVQTSPHDVVLCLYRKGEGCLLLSCDPNFARTHLIAKRPAGAGEPPGFCMALRSRLDNGVISNIFQVGFDRILHIEVETESGPHLLIAELMGRHSNLILVGPDKRIVSAAKTVGPAKSVRPIISGQQYQPPPFEPRPSLLKAAPDADLKSLEGASPFLIRLLEASSMSPKELGGIVASGKFEPVFVPESGAYPISVAAMEVHELPRDSISVALENHYSRAVPAFETEQLRGILLAQLKRILLAREVALADLEQAKEAASRASHLQLCGELVLAYGRQIEAGANTLSTVDYEGQLIEIKLNPELDYLANAEAYFKRAKKAKSGAGQVQDQIERLTSDHIAIQSSIVTVEGAQRLDELRDVQDLARAKRWLHTQPLAKGGKEERPYEGHRIRELLGPQGLRVLYGETATANDYLTLRVAKPNDYWLHVRAGTSAHVIIATNNQPDKVGREALMFAAKVAVKQSTSKHSGFVPVDYTLKKHVRKPRGAPVGTASYTHEKTLHVET
ncbi:MAG: NFACT family protein [Fimbriimonadaceae bacterium]